MLVVDPWHWLTDDGHLPEEPSRLRRLAVRVAQLIEAGGPLPISHARETLLECKRRPNGKPCLGLIWVVRTVEDTLHAFCPLCRKDEAVIHNWQDTRWANGPMDPIAVEVMDPRSLN